MVTTLHEAIVLDEMPHCVLLPHAHPADAPVTRPWAGVPRGRVGGSERYEPAFVDEHGVRGRAAGSECPQAAGRLRPAVWSIEQHDGVRVD